MPNIVVLSENLDHYGKRRNKTLKNIKKKYINEWPDCNFTGREKHEIYFVTMLYIRKQMST